MTTRIKLRRDTYQNWYDANPVLALGEAGYDITNNKLKIGDGVTAWRTLNYLAAQLQSDWTQSNNAALDFIKNKPAIPAPYASTSINALSDVDTVTSAPTNGQALVWNSAGSKWLPGTVAGGGGTTQPYLELTQSPFIVQPIVLGTPVTVSTPGDGSGAQVEVVIGEGPVITSVTVTTPGSGYIVGQRYKVWSYQIGGSNESRDSITFEVATVSSGGLLTVTDAAFTSETAANTPGTYGELSIAYQASPGDAIDDGVTLVRGGYGALFNIEAETEYDNNTYISPLGTEWNADGWGDLTKLGTRTYTTFRDALDGNVGNNIIGAELVMHDIINEKYYKFSFSNWGGNNGGSYAYTRTLVEDPNYFGKPDDSNSADFVDVIDNNIEITRGNANGIYNPAEENGWVQSTSPYGTEWNIDGWGDLTNVETRTYDNFYAAYDGQLGNKVQGSKAVMHVPSSGKYYAIQWLGWQQGGGGGFSYLRYELDLTQLQRGITFADGTRLNSAEDIVDRVKLKSPGDRRIEEAHGYKSVSLTSRDTSSTVTTTASQSNSNDRRYVGASVSVPQQAALIAAVNGDVEFYFEVSLDNNIWYKASYAGWNQTSFTFLLLNGATLTVAGGDTVYYRVVTGGDSVVWWSSADLPSGSGGFRGAIIDYHAFTGDGTWVGTIHIVDDDGEENITHTEVSSGSSDMENDDLWLVTNEGTISYRRIDGESSTLKIQWTAKVFYGSEIYD
jgi:hypothetical protein